MIANMISKNFIFLSKFIAGKHTIIDSNINENGRNIGFLFFFDAVTDLKKYLSSGDGERRKVKFVVNNAANNIRYLISIGEDVSEYENDVKELKTMVKEEDYEDFKGLVAFGFPKAK